MIIIFVYNNTIYILIDACQFYFFKISRILKTGGVILSTEETYDVTIIGGGPAGLFASFYSGLRGLKTKIIEFQPYLGGKIHVYPEKMVWDVGGLPPLPGAKLIEQLIQQGLTFDPTVILNTKVTSINRIDGKLFSLHTNDGQIHQSRTVIVSVGGGILQSQRLDLVDAEKYESTNLHYVMKPLHYFKNKTILISGGGHSAIDWASELEPIADKIYLTYRGKAFKGHEAIVERLKDKDNIECLMETTITALLSTKFGNRIEQVELTNIVSNERKYISIDEAIIHHGYIQDKTLLHDSPLAIDLQDDYFIKGHPTSESSIPGLYAAGDILKHEGKLHLIAGAFQDAANAVNMVKQFLDPEAAECGMVSSHNKRLKDKNNDILKEKYGLPIK